MLAVAIVVAVFAGVLVAAAVASWILARRRPAWLNDSTSLLLWRPWWFARETLNSIAASGRAPRARAPAQWQHRYAREALARHLVGRLLLGWIPRVRPSPTRKPTDEGDAKAARGLAERALPTQHRRAWRAVLGWGGLAATVVLYVAVAHATRNARLPDGVLEMKFAAAIDWFRGGGILARYPSASGEAARFLLLDSAFAVAYATTLIAVVLSVATSVVPAKTSERSPGGAAVRARSQYRRGAQRIALLAGLAGGCDLVENALQGLLMRGGEAWTWLAWPATLLAAATCLLVLIVVVYIVRGLLMSEREDPADSEYSTWRQRTRNRYFGAAYEDEVTGWINGARVGRGAAPVALRRTPDADGSVVTPSVQDGLAGLAISGGGMHSATFAIGALQALAEGGVLRQFDYLSTVSGGGLAASAVTSMLYADRARLAEIREAGANRAAPANLNRFGVDPENFPFVAPAPRSTSGGARVQPPEVFGGESPASRHIRESANLAATGGPLSVESLGAIAGYLLRTVMLWAIFLLPTLLLIAIPVVVLVDQSTWTRDVMGEGVEVAGRLARQYWIGGVLLGAALGLAVLGLRTVAALALYAGVAAIVVVTLALGLWATTNVDPVAQGVGWVVHSIEGSAEASPDTSAGADAPNPLAGGWTALVAAALGVLGSSRALGRLAGSEGVRRELWKIVLSLSGVLLFGALLLLLFKWLLELHLPPPDDPTGGRHEALLAALFAGSLGMMFIARVAGIDLLNNLSLRGFWQSRVARTWVVAGYPPDWREPPGDASADKYDQPDYGSADGAAHGDFHWPWLRAWSRPGVTLGDLRRSVAAGRQAGRGSPHDVPAPYPLYNCTLNIAGNSGTSFLDRRGDAFVLAPIVSGSSLTRWTPTAAHRDLDKLALERAAALSGAAFAPLMGRETGSVPAFVMTLLNVRLGEWARNPHLPPALQADSVEPRPWWKGGGIRGIVGPLGYYWSEAIGQASRVDEWVYVTDGGHFDNLGVYELLRRRCALIVVLDSTSGSAAAHAFRELAETTRLARIDLGVEIEIDLSPVTPRPHAGSGRRSSGDAQRESDGGTAHRRVRTQHAVGVIRYPSNPGAGEELGALVYVRGGVRDDHPPDIVAYQERVDPQFPDVGVVDLQYDEAQFEAMRKLGYLAGEEVAQHLADALGEHAPLPAQRAAAEIREQLVAASAVTRAATAPAP